MAAQVIFLATGGTGGHIFPAKALGIELKKRGFTPMIISDERFLKYTSENDIEYKILPVKQPKGGLKGKIISGLSIIKSFFTARKLIGELKPICVVGFGGYPSFPTMMAASQFRIKTIIHEQNSLLGKANEVLLKNVTKLATSFTDVTGINSIPKDKIVYVGNPVRQEIKAIRTELYPSFGTENNLNILVTGGSQGASAFSKIIPDAIALLPEALRKRIIICQQARAETVDNVKAIYEKLGVSATVQSFFTDMPERLRDCHVMIARSGASTLAEAGVAGRPVIMIPLPNSKGNHQMINAKSFEAKGGGITLDERELTADKLAKVIQVLFENPDQLNKLAANARNFGIVDADVKLADLVESLVSS